MQEKIQTLLKRGVKDMKIELKVQDLMRVYNNENWGQVISKDAVPNIFQNQ